MRKFILSSILAAFAATPALAEELVLYTSQPNADAQQTVDAFMAEYPDVKVTWVRDGTTKVMAKLQAEIAAGDVRPDLLLIADMVTLEGLKQSDQLQPYKSDAASAYDPALYDGEGYYYSTKLITTGIVYNTGAEFKPTSWQDLAKPDMKGMIAMPSPLYSGAALIHLATLTGDEALGWDYYQALAKNEARAQGGNGGTFKAVASGEKPYGVVVDYLAIRSKAKGSPVEFVFPEEGVSYVTEPVAILKTAKNVDAAHKFVDFLLSDKGQDLVLSQGYIPAKNGAAVPEGFPERSKIKLMSFDPASALANAEENKSRFAEMFGAQ
nr:ABC transporter substrate-binding protein [uncultured Cohaesibacter sp.]